MKRRTALRRKSRLRHKSVMPRAKIKDKLDEVHSKLIRAMYGNVCVVCGSTDRVGCGHILSRGHEATRWDVEPDGNCHPQCWPCNFTHGGERGPQNPAPYYLWYIKRFGSEALDRLYIRWFARSPYRSRVALEEKLHQMEELLEETLTHKPSEKMVERLRKEATP